MNKRYLSSLLYFVFVINSIPQEGNGKHITAHGNVHALFVFIQFDDDSLTKSKTWPYDTLSLPGWCYDFIDSSKKSTGKLNLTQYFSEMSNGKFLLTGDIYPKLIRPKHVQGRYKNIGEVNYEILTSIDSITDFSKYDNWTRSKSGEYIDSSDGIIDMVFLIYRNFENRLFFNNGWTGSAELYLTENIETNDGVTIKRGRMNSGIQMRGAKHGFHYTKYIAAHELGHFLFGAGHIEGVSNLALMTGGPVWNASRGMLSVEREQLGWINYYEVDTSIDSFYTLHDYMTTGEALCVKLSDTEQYIVENRQKLSRHDAAGDRGIYIYHVIQHKRNTPRITVKCADGNWDFEIDTASSKLRKLRPNVNGKSEMNFTKRVNRKGYSCYEDVYGSNDAWGDNTDAFDLTYNNVFSPVSNPSSANRNKIPFTIEIVEANEDAYSIQFYFNNVFAGKPSRPQDFNVVIDSSKKISLTWSANQEPDIARYHVYKKTSGNDPWELVDLVLHRNDISEFRWGGATMPSAKVDDVYYSLSVVDADVNESAKTDICSVNFNNENEKWVITNYAYR